MALKRGLTTAFGSILAVVLLYVAFGNVDGQGLKRQLGVVALPALLAMIGLSLTGLLARGWRWYLLLARPTREGEFWAIQRALAVSYAVGNLVSRLAEVVRIGMARSETRRSISALTGTVVLDRLIFDGLAFGLMLGSGLLLNRKALVTAFPQAPVLVWGIGGIILIGALGLFWLALAPRSVRRFLSWLHLDRIPKIGPFLVTVVDQASAGLSVLANPRFLFGAMAMNAVVWLLPFVYFCLVLAVFDVSAPLTEIWFVFSLTVVGVLIPSPGGLGSYHFMVTLGLTQILGLDAEKTAAIALVSHGVNYLTLFVVGLPAWLISRMAVKRNEHQAEVVR